MTGVSRSHWRACTVWLSMTSNIAVILALFVLDIRDLYYKVAWIGPFDSFSFVAGSTSILDSQPLVVSPDRDIRIMNSTVMDSGWPSFLSRCESLHAMRTDASGFFLSTMGVNCTINSAKQPIQRLVMTSDQRIDAVTWAACSLLHISRRPRICYERIVTGFYRRYMFEENNLLATVTPTKADSSAELELLSFLEMASEAFPMDKTVCVEAFEVTRISSSDHHIPTLYGCGSPNIFRSEFVGHLNPMVSKLLDHMAWLTADSISVMNARYLIRQNCFSRYQVHESAAGDGILVLQSFTATNFSSFGQLYALLIVIDVILLTLNCLSSLELVRWMSFPKYNDVKSWAEQKEAARSRGRGRKTRHRAEVNKRSHILGGLFRRSRNRHANPVMPDHEGDQPSAGPRLTRIQRRRRLLATMEAMSGIAAIEEEQLYSFFSRSLYRNSRIVVITLTTQLMSWLLVLPNAVVWTWSFSTHERVQAYLSSIRCWVLLLLVCNLLWSIVVRISERHAYEVTKRTFLTSIDLVFVASMVSFMWRREIFAMSEEKWALEHQRVTDSTSFSGGFLAHGNTFNSGLDSIRTTPLEIFRVLYEPLVRILGTSIGVVIVILSLKAIYFSQRRRILFQGFHRSVSQRLAYVSRRLSRVSSSSLGGKGSNNMAALARSATPQPGPVVSDPDEEDEELIEAEEALKEALREPYHRLPLEEWLDRPIRATSLIRNGLRMETVRDSMRFIRPSCYLDFGIIVKRGVIHSRIGFTDAWMAKMTVHEYMTRVEHQAPTQPELHLQSARKTSLESRTTSYTLAGNGRELAPRLSSSSRAGSSADMRRKRSLHVPLT